LCQSASLLLNQGDVLQLLLDLLDPAYGIPGHFVKQIVEPLGGVVEVGDGLIQLVYREVGEHILKFAKGSPRFPQDLFIRAVVVCMGGNKVAQSPKALILVIDIGLAILGVVVVETPVPASGRGCAR